MRNALIERLQTLRNLGPEAQSVIRFHSQKSVSQPAEPYRKFNRRASSAFILLEGLASQSRLLGNGRRQIVALLTPGAAVDVLTSVYRTPLLAIEFLTPCKIIRLSGEDVDQILSQPELRQALEIQAEIDRNVAYEWITSNGRRSVEHKICHLLCEILVRYKCAGTQNWRSVGIPLTQAELSDIFGISVVHINKTIFNLRQRGLIKSGSSRRLLEIDYDAMAKFCDFDSSYLEPNAGV